jgi:hypothetical protein
VYAILARGADSIRTRIALGLAIGLAAYVRANMLSLVALVFFHRWLTSHRIIKSFHATVIVSLTTIVTLTPLCYFNKAQFGRFTPMVSNAALLWYGNNPEATSTFHAYAKVPEDFPPHSRERRRLRARYASFHVNPDSEMDFGKMDSYEISIVKMRYGLGWIRDNPLRYAWLALCRAKRFFWQDTYGEVPYLYYDQDNPRQPRWGDAAKHLIETIRLPARSWFRFLITMSLLGLMITVATHGGSRFIADSALPLLIVALYCVPFLLIAVANRYHIPILCLLWTYIGHGAWTAVRFLWKRSG